MSKNTFTLSEALIALLRFPTPEMLSWISSALVKFRLKAFGFSKAQLTRYPDYARLRSLHPCRNPLKQVQHDRANRQRANTSLKPDKPTCHPEFISGSDKWLSRVASWCTVKLFGFLTPEIPKQVRDDSVGKWRHGHSLSLALHDGGAKQKTNNSLNPNKPTCHPEFISGSQRTWNPSFSPAFTLAEVLITLTIIGIVAAMTVPSLLVNVNEKAWDAQRKALHARLAQALPMLPRLNNYGTFTYETDDEGETEITADTAAETFVATALSSVYKIVNVCGGDEPDLTSCGLPETYTTLDGTTTNEFPTDLETLNSKLISNTDMVTTNALGAYSSLINTKAVGIETANGESIAVFYNPYCESDSTSYAHFVQSQMCVNFIYDLNGSKGPNRVGKDIGFVTALYRNNPVVVAPMPYTSNASDGSAFDPGLCKEQDEDYRMPDRDELAAMYINQSLLNITTGSTNAFHSGSIYKYGNYLNPWYVDFDNGCRGYVMKSDGRKFTNATRCVRK